MIRGLIRLAIYFGVGYMLLKFVNRLLINMGKTPLTGAKAVWRIPSRHHKNVIDICPRCGNLKEARHSCQ